jgi:hypothetical protein
MRLRWLQCICCTLRLTAHTSADYEGILLLLPAVDRDGLMIPLQYLIARVYAELWVESTCPLMGRLPRVAAWTRHRSTVSLELSSSRPCQRLFPCLIPVGCASLSSRIFRSLSFWPHYSLTLPSFSLIWTQSPTKGLHLACSKRDLVGFTSMICLGRPGLVHFGSDTTWKALRRFNAVIACITLPCNIW